MWRKLVERVRFFYGLTWRTQSIYAILARQYREEVLAREAASDPRKITAYGFTAFSMSDTDGILQEIFRRIGVTNRLFVEFGCGDGLENETVYLLLTGWSGLWMDGDEAGEKAVREKFSAFLADGRLKHQRAFLTRENINAVIEKGGIHGEIDLLSIDIDGNDYWLWEAIDGIRPRVVTIEYNATFRPPVKIVQEYNASHCWDGTNYGGASLKALEDLGHRKGYLLIGCNFAGTNAFFVRKDLAGPHFSEPFTAENHYREAFYDAFVRGGTRHPRGVGPYRLLP